MSLVVDGTKGLGFSSALNGAGGRLTLASGVPVMTSSVAVATSVYYCPYIGRYVPLYDGSIFSMRDFASELPQALSDTSKSPAAALPEACYDMFVWDDGGVIRLSRGPPWLATATVTMTIANPCVVTWNAHGLHEGSPVILTTTGALATGLTAGTIYYVGRSPTANTFNLSVSAANAAAGTNITTTGTQSGVHTGTNRDSVRGSGAGTTELVRVGGLPLNAQTITNGPLAQRGTYVGTIRTNATSTVDYILGGAASGGVAAVLGVWNCYNRISVCTNTIDNGAAYTYSPATVRQARASISNQLSFVYGLAEDDVFASYGIQFATAAVATAGGAVGLGYDNTTVFSGQRVWSGNSGAGIGTFGPLAVLAVPTPIGSHTISPLELSNGTNNLTLGGSTVGTEGYLSGRLRM